MRPFAARLPRQLPLVRVSSLASTFSRPVLPAIQSGGFSPQTTRRGIIYLPAILQPSLWRSLTPSFLRRDKLQQNIPKKGWNPATFYIWMFLLIGSQAIQLLTLRGHFNKFSVETDAKLATLREVLRKVQNGEDIDVKKELGAGDPKKEREWEDVVKELEAEDRMFRARRKKVDSKASAP